MTVIISKPSEISKQLKGMCINSIIKQSRHNLNRI